MIESLWCYYSWTTSSITCIETSLYQSFSYFYVATDDGDIHVRTSIHPPIH